MLRTDDELRRASIVEFFSHVATAYFGFFIIVIAIRDYGFSEASAGVLVTMQGAAFVFALFTLGFLFNRLGQLPYFRVSLTLCAVALALLAYHGAPIVLWSGAVLLGLGLGMLHIANFLLYARIGRRLGMGRVSGLTALVGPSGGLLGGLVGGWIGQFWGLQALFLPMAFVFAWLVADIRKLASVASAPVLATPLLTEMEGKS
jgi:MFS family permease